MPKSPKSSAKEGKPGSAKEGTPASAKDGKQASARARLREHYQKTVVPALTKEFSYKNVMAVPKLEKISINIGLGEATQNAKLMDGAANELGQIAGQKPVGTTARKCI